jgi:uncharacterized protein (TIGR02594 family)
MNKILLAATVAIGAILASDIAHATPKHHHVVKHYKHHKVKKHIDKVKPVAEEPINLAALRTHDDSTSAGYWANEAAVQEAIRKHQQNQPIVDNKVALTTDEKRKVVAKGCSWFSCDNEATAVVAAASDWIGKEAKKDKQALKKLFKAEWNDPIDPQHVAWCAAFANAILRRQGYETTHSLMARSFLNWGKVTHDPKQGDIVVLARGRNSAAGHVGFFMGYEWFEGVKYVKVLGGNTDHAVQVGYFPASKVVGYRTFA